MDDSVEFCESVVEMATKRDLTLNDILTVFDVKYKINIDEKIDGQYYFYFSKYGELCEKKNSYFCIIVNTFVSISLVFNLNIFKYNKNNIYNYINNAIMKNNKSGQKKLAFLIELGIIESLTSQFIKNKGKLTNKEIDGLVENVFKTVYELYN